MSLLHDYTYRILVIGDSNTGKTHIFSNLATNKHISNQIFRPTIGVDFHGKHISSCSKKIKLQIWDTSGDPNFKRIGESYYTSVAAAIIVYDISNRDSFLHVIDWLKDFREKNQKLCNPPILVVGNQVYSEKARVVQRHELETFGNEYNTMVAEVQSCDMEQLQHIFQPLWNKITGQYVIPERYSPGVKRLTRPLYLPKNNINNRIPIHAREYVSKISPGHTKHLCRIS